MKFKKEILVTGQRVDQVFRGICRYAQSNGWCVHTNLTANPRNRTARSFNAHDGVILVHAPYADQMKATVSKVSVPMVQVGSRHMDVGVPRVWSDDHRVGRLAAQYLIDNRFRSLVYLGSSNVRRLQDDKWLGFEEEARMQGRETLFFSTKNKCVQAYASHDLPPPVGLLTIDAPWGEFVCKTFWKLGVKIPEEIAVLAGGGMGWGDFMSMPLSYVDTREEVIGFEAARVLDERIDGRSSPTSPTLIPPGLIVASESTGLPAIDNAYVRQAVEILHRSFCNPVDIRELARQTGICRYRLDQTFKAELGTTIHGYLTKLRICRAEILLKDPSFSIAEVARKVGFASHENFSRSFKTITGSTPSTRRKR